MTPTTLRALGIIFMVAAAVAAILNLKRVADLGTLWLAPLLIMFGAIFMIMARRARR